MQLNKEQSQAVRYIDGPLLVLAGAGSGKTRVITQKIAYLIEQCGIKANKIAAVTFTNKSAREMSERVALTIDKPLRRGLKVSTFHTLGLNILKREYAHIDLKSNFTLMDAEDSLSIIRNLLTRHEASDREFLYKVQSQLSNFKNAMFSPSQLKMQAHTTPEAVTAAKIYERYEATLKAYNALDFDDLILKPVQLFLSKPERLNDWQNRIHYLLVDEYQDTNQCQYQLVQLLMRERGALTVVGDDDQSIYAWRGAMPENLSLLSKDFKNLKIIKLEQNYRSSACILTSANHLISHNPHLFEKKLWSTLGHGELIRVIQTKDEFHEAEQVASEILAHKLQTASQFGDYAILYRSNFQSRLIEKALRNHGINYKLTGGQSYFSRAEIKDVFAYLRLMANFDDDNAFLRIVNTPKRGIGTSTLEKLQNYASTRAISLFNASNEFGLQTVLSEKALTNLREFYSFIYESAKELSDLPDFDSLKDFLFKTEYEEYLYQNAEEPKFAERRMQNVLDLLEWIARLANKKPEKPLTLAEVIQKLILLDMLDRDEGDMSEHVQMMTLHASKGLEFPHVYLVGMEEGMLPHLTSIEEENIEEERRLAYVGVTRAQRTLSLTYAQKRKRYGETVDNEISRFVSELPENSLEWSGVKSSNSDRPKEKGKHHLASLKAMLQN